MALPKQEVQGTRYKVHGEDTFSFIVFALCLKPWALPFGPGFLTLLTQNVTVASQGP
jgi:hypothetical protein